MLNFFKNLISKNNDLGDTSNKRECDYWYKEGIGRKEYIKCSDDKNNKNGYNKRGEVDNIYNKDATCVISENGNRFNLTDMLNRCERVNNCKGIFTNREQDRFCMYTNEQLQNLTKFETKKCKGTSNDLDKKPYCKYYKNNNIEDEKTNENKIINGFPIWGNLYIKGPLPNYTQDIKKKCTYTKKKSEVYSDMYEINARVAPGVADVGAICSDPKKKPIDCLKEKQCDGFVKNNGRYQGIRCGDRYAKNMFDMNIMNNPNSFTCDNNNKIYLNSNINWLK